MEEAAPAHDAVAGIVAVGDAVDGREVAGALVDAEAGGADAGGRRG